MAMKMLIKDISSACEHNAFTLPILSFTLPNIPFSWPFCDFAYVTEISKHYSSVIMWLSEIPFILGWSPNINTMPIFVEGMPIFKFC